MAPMETATVGMATIETATVEMAKVDVNTFQEKTTETMNLTVSRIDVHAETTIPAALATIQSTETLQQNPSSTDKGKAIATVGMPENDMGGRYRLTIIL